MECGFVSHSMMILEKSSLYEEIHEVDHHEKLVFLVILQNLEKCLENVLVLVLMEYGNGYSLKDKNKGKTDKTEHGNEMSVKSQSQRRVHLKWTNPYPS
ncbi:hypothetical protein Tco_1453552 [Tanacetum coccineum]